jgi:hypothetical protein
VDLSSWGLSAQSAIIDNAIVEVNAANQIVWEWDVADHINVAAENVNWHSQFPDVIHMNSVTYDGNGGVIFSARHLDAVYRVDMATGAITWKLGGSPTPESLTVAGDQYVNAGGQLFSGQHYARLQPDGSLTVHDNGTRANRLPRAVRFTINTSNSTATEVEQVTDSRTTTASCCGSVEKLPGGDWVMGWGANDFTTELSPAGVPQVTITYPGIFSYRTADDLASIDSLRQGMDAMVPPVATLPSTAVALPANGATLSGGQWLDASASPGTTKVQFDLTGGTLNDTVISPATPTAYGWLGGFSTMTVPNGTYTLQSVAYDAAGDNAFSAPVTVTVNNPAPTTSVLLPSNGATLSGGQWLGATASSGVSTVQFELTGGTLNDTVVAPATLTAYGWLGGFSTTTVPNGTYTLQSVASYSGGVAGTSPGITVTINNPAPTTTVLLPSNGATLSGGQWLGATASPGVSSVQFELTGGTMNHTVVAPAILTAYGWLGGFSTATVPNGIYALQSVASYSGGVTGTSSGILITISN